MTETGSSEIPAGSPRTENPRPVSPRLAATGGRQASLDGLRAVAAFGVLLFHVSIETGTALREGFIGGILARGEVGVPIFFTLSGLLLYRPWARSVLEGSPDPDTRTYLWKRLLRIMPAYWLVVVVALLLWADGHRSDLWTWTEMLLLLHNYDIDHWWYGLGPQGLGQMWSLSVEVAFYLTLPIMAAALRAFATRGGAPVDVRAKRLLIGLAAFGALSYVYTVFEFHPDYRPWMNIWLPRSWTFFVPGMMLAVVAAWARTGAEGPQRFSRAVHSSTGSLWLVAGLAYVIAATPVTGARFVGIDGMWAGLVEQALYTTVAFCLVAPAALQPDRGGLAGSVLGGRVMSYLGRVSYSVFLWQFVVLYLWRDFTGQKTWTGDLVLNFVPVAGLTLLLAHLTYRYVEEPARRLIHYVTPRPDPATEAALQPAP
ncbi:acyltransferase family protein [Planotetraspora kaengkrachanensis]|uniref:Acyltransferase n=1 Tax=Planotetraspora kaengkrachanensis TaxID=575193 RepID=A0A8J3PVF7_9ACTN|nr:acyltransferase [Planotetraspora kaengkrachanensis]GIG81742.1 acyltransferase [Planotetraspora kaengkrachanensis]